MKKLVCNNAVNTAVRCLHYLATSSGPRKEEEVLMGSYHGDCDWYLADCPLYRRFGLGSDPVNGEKPQGG